MICFVLFFNLLFVKCGRTPLHRAAENDSEETVKVLLEQGSNLHLQDHVLIFFFFFFVFSYLLMWEE